MAYLYRAKGDLGKALTHARKANDDALIDTLLLGVAVIVYAVINPGLSPERRIEWPPYEMFLGAVTCLYFGARS